MTKQEQFFYDHAGSSYEPDVETREQGRVRGARELAQAETWAVQNGYSFDIEPDPNVDESFMDEADGEYQAKWRGKGWWCAMRDGEGKVVQSLGGCFGYADYKRVVRAELALEEMGRVEVAK